MSKEHKCSYSIAEDSEKQFVLHCDINGRKSVTKYSTKAEAEAVVKFLKLDKADKSAQEPVNKTEDKKDGGTK